MAGPVAFGGDPARVAADWVAFGAAVDDGATPDVVRLDAGPYGVDGAHASPGCRAGVPRVTSPRSQPVPVAAAVPGGTTATTRSTTRPSERARRPLCWPTPADVAGRRLGRAGTGGSRAESIAIRRSESSLDTATLVAPSGMNLRPPVRIGGLAVAVGFLLLFVATFLG
jgi:hypothetical protein